MTRKLLHVAFAFALALAGPAASLFAEDVVELKNGKTYTGEILEQTEDYIKIKTLVGGIEQTYTIFIHDVETVTRGDAEGGASASAKEDAAASAGSPAGTETAGAETVDPETAAEIAADPNLADKKVFVIPMQEVVGITFRADKLEEAVEAARPFKPDVIVLEIDSPGGLVSEIFKLRDAIQEIRNEFRVVVWIKSAISAAAMTSLNVREIYFKREGHIGAATMWYSDGSGAKAVTGPELEYFIEQVSDFVTSAGYDPIMVKKMIKPDGWLSADVEVMPNGERKVTWYDNQNGEFLVSRDGEILTLTASQAEFFGISLGTADTPEELAELLNLKGWVEVSDAGRKIMKEWKHAVERLEIELPRLYREYANPASTIDDRIRVCRKLLEWVKKYPELVEDAYQMPDGSGLPLNERSLERLIKQLSRAKRDG